MSEKPDLINISDQKLIDLCREHNCPAWDEFFRRFIPTIKHTIKATLVSRSRYDLLQDNDTIWNIHEKIVVKLYCRGILQQCRNPSGISAWLKTVARHQT